MNKRITFIAGLAALLLLPGIAGCGKTFTVKYAGGPVAQDAAGNMAELNENGIYHYPEEPQTQPHKMYSYNYYPSSNVYYDKERKLYFFTNGDEWYDSPFLPPNFNIDPKEVVTVQRESEKPFLATAPQP